MTKATKDGTTVEYAYDPLGRLYKTTDNGVVTEHLYDGVEPISDFDGQGRLLRRYINGAGVDERVLYLSYNPSNGYYASRWYYRTDHQGSVIAMIRNVDDPVQKYAYDEYGNLTKGEMIQPFGYTGRRYDETTGLYYYRARWYNPSIGRFMQTDPIGYQDDMNMYAYVGNDPMNHTDPLGLYRDGDVCNPGGELSIRCRMPFSFHEARKAGWFDDDNRDTERPQLSEPPSVSVLRSIVEFFLPDYEAPIAGSKTLETLIILPVGKVAKLGKVGRHGGKMLWDCCFVAGTPVLTESGFKNIEDIQIGELVWSRNPETAEQALKPVLATVPRHDRVIWEVIVNGENGATETFETTEEHPWWVDGKSWKRTDELTFGMRIEDSKQNVLVVISVRNTNRVEGTYNITVADFETYYVGKLHVLVHNCRFRNLKDHARRHGNGQNAAQYFSSASAHLRNAQKRFRVRHNGQNKFAHVTRTGPDAFTFTSSNKSGSKIYTHMYEVSEQYLRNKGITLPDGF